MKLRLFIFEKWPLKNGLLKMQRLKGPVWALPSPGTLASGVLLPLLLLASGAAEAFLPENPLPENAPAEAVQADSSPSRWQQIHVSAVRAIDGGLEFQAGSRLIRVTALSPSIALVTSHSWVAS